MSFATLVRPEANGGIGLAFTDREGGTSLPPYDSLNLGRMGDDNPDHLRRNYAIVADEIHASRMAILGQVHGTHVVRIGSDTPVVEVSDEFTDQGPQGDAMVTTNTAVALVIRVADCVPVLFADRHAGVIGAAHAGRVGLLAGVLQETVRVMREVGATQIEAWLGPHICAGCYEVPPQMAHHAWDLIPATQSQSHHGTTAIDLGAGAEAILLAQDVRVNRFDPCTSCESRFFSHRRDQAMTGRQAGLIWGGNC